MCLRCTDPLSEGFGVLAKAPSGNHDFQAMQEALKPALSCVMITKQLAADLPDRPLCAVRSARGDAPQRRPPEFIESPDAKALRRTPFWKLFCPN